MYLEEKHVLKKRFTLPLPYGEKEWWYSGFYDKENDIYCSFFFIRIFLTDAFNFVVFDRKTGETMTYYVNMFLDKKQPKDKLALNYHSKDVTIEYNGDAENGWKFKFKNKEYHVEFDLQPEMPYFTKFDNEFKYVYNLMHFFHNRVNGFIHTPKKKYQVKDAMCYYDHCFGKVPKHSHWHWIAVQNEDVALASLVNYGAFSQLYTEAFFKENSKSPRKNEWIRLEQAVSFEAEILKERFTKNWRITSTELDLEVEPIMYIMDRQKIPPVVPFLLNVRHYEFFVKVWGRIRVEGMWVEVEDLYGVLEEHSAIW